MTKKELLTALEAELANNERLPLRESNLVFGEGDLDAKVMFVGEAPGFYENEARLPFVGRAGKLLNSLLEEIGWKREDVYITNIVKRRPPENRDPSPHEIAAYSPYLARQIEIISPTVIVTLGRFSMNYFVATLKITRDQGKVFRLGNGSTRLTTSRFLYPVFHPAAALRSPVAMEALRKSFKKLPAVVRKCESLAKENSPAPSSQKPKPALF